MKTYQQRIAETVTDVDACYIEGMMRSYHGTLDHLSAEEFAEEAKVAAECCRDDPGIARAVAASFGLVRS